MSKDDGESQNNEPDKKIRDNVSPELRPKNVQHRNLAPRGSIGINPPAFGQSLNPRSSRNNSAIERTASSNVTPERNPQDHRSDALRTDDKEVDALYGKEYRLIDEGEVKNARKQAALDQLKETSYPERLSPSSIEPQQNKSSLALRTGDKEVDAHYSKTNHLIDDDGHKKMRKKAAIDQLKNDRGQTFKRER